MLEPTETTSRPAARRRTGGIASRAASLAADLAAQRAASVLASVWRRFGQPPFGDAIDADTLRELIAGLRPVADASSREMLERLESTADDVTVEMRVFFPGNDVASVVRSLRSVDLAWRIAKLVAEPDDAALPAGSIVNLDELVPPADDGLQFAVVEVGSLRVSLGQTRAQAKRLACFAAILPALCGVSGYTVKDAVQAFGTTTSGQQCQVPIQPVDAPLESSIRQQIGPLAPGTTVDIDVVTSDGATVTMHVSTPDQPPT